MYKRQVFVRALRIASKSLRALLAVNASRQVKCVRAISEWTLSLDYSELFEQSLSVACDYSFGQRTLLQRLLY